MNDSYANIYAAPSASTYIKAYCILLLQRRNRRTRREPITVVDLEVESSREG
jgi:hypothetical protein